MHLRAVVLAVTLALALGGCKAELLFNKDLRSLANLDPAHAEADVLASIARGDSRLIGIYGYTVDVPGAPHGSDGGWDQSHLRMLEGTTDGPQTALQAGLNERGRAYATRYNRALISRRGDQAITEALER